VHEVLRAAVVVLMLRHRRYGKRIAGILELLVLTPGGVFERAIIRATHVLHEEQVDRAG
jgi:hypothetical protein